LKYRTPTNHTTNNEKDGKEQP